MGLTARGLFVCVPLGSTNTPNRPRAAELEGAREKVAAGGVSAGVAVTAAVQALMSCTATNSSSSRRRIAVSGREGAADRALSCDRSRVARRITACAASPLPVRRDSWVQEEMRPCRACCGRQRGGRSRRVAATTQDRCARARFCFVSLQPPEFARLLQR